MTVASVDQLLTQSHLPEEIRATIRRVLQRSDLSSDRALDVGRELVDHFEDGLARGHGARELLESFGDPAQAGEGGVQAECQTQEAVGRGFSGHEFVPPLEAVSSVSLAGYGTAVLWWCVLSARRIRRARRPIASTALG